MKTNSEFLDVVAVLETDELPPAPEMPEYRVDPDSPDAIPYPDPEEWDL